MIENESDYYPWGGELQISNHDLGNHYKFTGKERDAETGLDYFGARYYSNGLGRFITPDWAVKAAAVPYADFADPQSLNLYTYVRNIPTTKYDADGHDGLMDTVAWVTAHIVVPVLVWMDKHPPPPTMPSVPSLPPTNPFGVPGCRCPSPQNNNNANKNQNNSQSSNTAEQGRDAQGKFTSKQPGQSQPGAGAEKQGLDAVGATKNTKPLSNGRIPDGTMPDGQKVEIKSGEIIGNTKQLRDMGQGAMDDTGKPLKVVTTNPNVTKPALDNKNLEFEHKPQK